MGAAMRPDIASKAPSTLISFAVTTDAVPRPCPTVRFHPSGIYTSTKQPLANEPGDGLGCVSTSGGQTRRPVWSGRWRSGPAPALATDGTDARKRGVAARLVARASVHASALVLASGLVSVKGAAIRIPGLFWHAAPQ